MVQSGWQEQWHRFRAGLAHAFDLPPRSGPLPADARRFLEGLAARIARRRLTVPAFLLLESLAPLHGLGSQLLHAVAPVLGAVCDEAELQRVADLLARPGSVEAFLGMIEAAGRTREGGP